MDFLLDTNAISDSMSGHGVLVARCAAVTLPNRILTSTIVREEIRFGIERRAAGGRRAELERKAQAVFTSLVCIPVGDAVANAYGRLKADCQGRGYALDDNDLWIAATAGYSGATVITRDADFRRIPGLRVEDWTVPTASLNSNDMLVTGVWPNVT